MEEPPNVLLDILVWYVRLYKTHDWMWVVHLFCFAGLFWELSVREMSLLAGIKEACEKSFFGCIGSTILSLIMVALFFAFAVPITSVICVYWFWGATLAKPRFLPWSDHRPKSPDTSGMY